MHTIHLPSFAYDGSTLQTLCGCFPEELNDDLCIDFSAFKFYAPAAIAFLCSQARARMEKGHNVRVVNYEEIEALRYLQRIDLFSSLGIDLREDFDRRPENNRFVPLREVPHSPTTSLNDTVANDLARCLARTKDTGNDLYLLSQYAVGEVIANAKQHSAAECSYVSAQYYSTKGLARIGVADAGRGILASFRDNASPLFTDGMSDLDAIKLALAPNVSSVTHLPPPMYGRHSNFGLGLSMLQSLVNQAFGNLFIATGNGWWWQDGRKDPVEGNFPNGPFSGTVISAAFESDNVDDYTEMRKEAWRTTDA